LPALQTLSCPDNQELVALIGNQLRDRVSCARDHHFGLNDLLRANNNSKPHLARASDPVHKATATELDPMDDNRGSAEYKREMVKVLVRRVAQEAVRRLPE
jgi:CO/xanthine dehydrogenase FAD-binding subunit